VHVVDRMNEGQLAVRRDVQVAYLVGDRAICSEDVLPCSTLIVSPDVSQGLDRDIERNEVGCKEGHDAVDVLRANGLRVVLYALSNEGFSHGFLLLTLGHGWAHDATLQASLPRVTARTSWGRSRWPGNHHRPHRAQRSGPS